MFNWRSASERKQLWRYYQAGIVNTLFGYALYALFVALGMNIYVAQIASHVAGAAFNYFTYSRHAFRGQQGSKVRFTLSYVANYFLGLAALAIAAPLAGPYAAGIVSIVFVSLVNYLILKRLVFKSGSAA